MLFRGCKSAHNIHRIRHKKEATEAAPFPDFKAVLRDLLNLQNRGQ